jgi:hypothetical protein
MPQASPPPVRPVYRRGVLISWCIRTLAHAVTSSGQAFVRERLAHARPRVPLV